MEPILAGLRPLFERHSGMVLVTDVAVSRQEYFGRTPKKGGQFLTNGSTDPIL